MNKKTPSIQVESLIYQIRGQKVILDTDLANLYGVETRQLNQAIKRNPDRFPPDFMFQLSSEETDNLKSQFVISSWGGRRTLPYVFTEHGAIMAASVLNSIQAVEMSIYVVRAFVNLRSIHLQYKEIAQQVSKLESKITKHDKAIVNIIQAIKQLMEPPTKTSKEIGFKVTKSQ